MARPSALHRAKPLTRAPGYLSLLCRQVSQVRRSSIGTEMHPSGPQVTREGSRIRIAGKLDQRSFRLLLASIHQATADKGLQKLTLDFTGTTRAYPGGMLPVLVTCARLRDEADVDFALVRPKDGELRRLFANTNWAHLATPSRFRPSSWQPESVLPASRFASPDEQHRIVDRIMDAVLSSPAAVARESLAAFEWAVNEITDNVLQHAEAPLGGLVQLGHYPNAQWLEFVVADSGRGIPDTIRTARPGMPDPDALELSIQRGITRDKRAGQGNGLFGTHRAARVGDGAFEIHSGYASLGSDLEARREKIPFPGTLVVVRLDYSDPAALWQALDIQDARLEPQGDYVQLRYERMDDETLHFVVKREAGSLGSRSAGKSARRKLEKLLSMYPDALVNLDFESVGLVSSSFADEFLGKLFIRVGALGFSRRIRFRGVTPTVQSIVDKAILQRAHQEVEGD